MLHRLVSRLPNSPADRLFLGGTLGLAVGGWFVHPALAFILPSLSLIAIGAALGRKGI